MNIKYIIFEMKDRLFAICDELKEHELSSTWIISSVVVIISLMIRFVFYVFELGRCNYWGISSNAIKITENSILSFVYSLFYAILLIIYTFCIYKTMKFNSNKILISIVGFILMNVGLFCFLISINLLIAETFADSFKTSCAVHVLCFLLALLYIISKNKHKKENKKIDLINDLPTYFIVFLLFSIVIYNYGIKEEKERKKFRIIDDQYAIVYSNSDYYYLAKYDIAKKEIDSSIQKIIKIEDVEFSIVNIDDDLNTNKPSSIQQNSIK